MFSFFANYGSVGRGGKLFNFCNKQLYPDYPCAFLALLCNCVDLDQPALSLNSELSASEKNSHSKLFSYWRRHLMVGLRFWHLHLTPGKQADVWERNLVFANFNVWNNTIASDVWRTKLTFNDLTFGEATEHLMLRGFLWRLTTPIDI